jgi:Holliday junction resolvase YEN1
MYSLQEPASGVPSSSREVDELLGTFSGLSIMSPTPGVKRYPMTNQSRVRTRRGILGGGGADLEELDTLITGSDVRPSQPALPRGIKMSYSVSQPQGREKAIFKTPVRSTLRGHHPREKKKQGSPDPEEAFQVEELQEAVDSLSLSPSKQHIRHKSPVQRSSPKKVRTPDILIPSPRNQTTGFLPPERLTRLDDQSRASGTRTLVTAAQRQLPSEHITPSSDKSCKTNNRKASIPKPRTTPRRVNDQSEPQTIGHVENITTQDGFWTVEAAGSELASERSSGGNQSIQSKDGKEGKKRIPRVSILDLI